MISYLTLSEAKAVIPSVERGNWGMGGSRLVMRATTHPVPSLDARDDKEGR